MIPLECPDCAEYRFAGIAGLCPACEQDMLDAERRRIEEDIDGEDEQTIDLPNTEGN